MFRSKLGENVIIIRICKQTINKKYWELFDIDLYLYVNQSAAKHISQSTTLKRSITIIQPLSYTRQSTGQSINHLVNQSESVNNSETTSQLVRHNYAMLLQISQFVSQCTQSTNQSVSVHHSINKSLIKQIRHPSVSQSYLILSINQVK